MLNPLNIEYLYLSKLFDNSLIVFNKRQLFRFFVRFFFMTAALPNDSKPKLTPAWTVIFFFTSIHLVALLAFLPQFFSWKAVGMAFLLYVITGGIGITLGFHRCISHRSFNVPKWLEYIFVICGTLACQGAYLSGSAYTVCTTNFLTPPRIPTILIRVFGGVTSAG